MLKYFDVSNMIGVKRRMSVAEFRNVGAKGTGSSGCWAKYKGLCVSGKCGKGAGREQRAELLRRS